METYRFVEGPLLKQILTQRQVMIPITMKIRVVTINPIFYFDDLTNCHGPRHSYSKFWNRNTQFTLNRMYPNCNITSQALIFLIAAEKRKSQQIQKFGATKEDEKYLLYLWRTRNIQIEARRFRFCYGRFICLRIEARRYRFCSSISINELF